MIKANDINWFPKTNFESQEKVKNEAKHSTTETHNHQPE